MIVKIGVRNEGAQNTLRDFASQGFNLAKDAKNGELVKKDVRLISPWYELFQYTDDDTLLAEMFLIADIGVDSRITHCPTHPGHLGSPPLHLAADFGHLKTVKAMLEWRADPNARDYYGCTPLHYAVLFGHIEVIRTLLESGADINPVDRRGMTPLDIIDRKYHTKNGEEVLAILRAKGANLGKNCFNGNLDQLLDVARYGNAEELESIFRSGIDVGVACNAFGDTALHGAAFVGNMATTKTLLKRDANPNAQNANGDTPMHFAQVFHSGPEMTRGDKWSVFRVLHEHGGKTHLRNKDGIAPKDFYLMVDCSEL